MLHERETHMKKDSESVTAKWSEGHRVLGHVTKSDLKKPKAQLALGDFNAGRNDDVRPSSDCVRRSGRGGAAEAR
jgi:hypothetical protein